MAEQERPTFEEAKKCPKCKQPGEDRKTLQANSQNGLPRGTAAHEIYCMNDKCKWFNTPWIVQVNADGSIPAPQDHSRTKKHYVGFENHDREAAALMDALKRDNEASLRSGEIRRRGM